MQTAQPAHRTGIAGIPRIELGIPRLQKPAAGPDRKGRNQTGDNGEGQMPRHDKGQRPDGAGNARHQKMRIEHAAQQPGDFRDVEFHQQKGGLGQKEIAQRKKQDDNGGQGDGVRHQAASPSLSFHNHFGGPCHRDLGARAGHDRNCLKQSALAQL